MGGGNSTPQTITTTQNKDPWAGAQPYLQEANKLAQNLYYSDQGYVPYSGQTQAPMQKWFGEGITGQAQLGTNNLYGSPGVVAGQNLAKNVIDAQGITPGIQSAISGLGQTNAQLGSFLNAWNPETANMYRASYNQASGQENPYLQATLDAQGRKIADQVNSTMSGAGRYGSGAHTNVLSRNLAEAADPILAQDYQNRQQQQLQAAQGMLGANSQQLAAIQGSGQIYGQLADMYGQGLNRAGQYAQLSPQLDQAQYMGAQQLTSAGQALQNRDQAEIQRQMDLYNAQQARPWEQLARYNAIIGGSGSLGGSTVTTAPNTNAPVGGLTGALGGALAGAGVGGSIFGPAGAALGGLGGGLLGYLR